MIIFSHNILRHFLCQNKTHFSSTNLLIPGKTNAKCVVAAAATLSCQSYVELHNQTKSGLLHQVLQIPSKLVGVFLKTFLTKKKKGKQIIREKKMN